MKNVSLAQLRSSHGRPLGGDILEDIFTRLAIQMCVKRTSFVTWLTFENDNTHPVIFFTMTLLSAGYVLHTHTQC